MSDRQLILYRKRGFFVRAARNFAERAASFTTTCTARRRKEIVSLCSGFQLFLNLLLFFWESICMQQRWCRWWPNSSILLIHWSDCQNLLSAAASRAGLLWMHFWLFHVENVKFFDGSKSSNDILPLVWIERILATLNTMKLRFVAAASSSGQK